MVGLSEPPDDFDGDMAAAWKLLRDFEREMNAPVQETSEPPATEAERQRQREQMRQDKRETIRALRAFRKAFDE